MLLFYFFKTSLFPFHVLLFLLFAFSSLSASTSACPLQSQQLPVQRCRAVCCVSNEGLCQGGRLRPGSADFPRLEVVSSPGLTRVIESERLVGETVTRRTEEYTDPDSGEPRLRTVEIVERLIEREVLRLHGCTTLLTHTQ